MLVSTARTTPSTPRAVTSVLVVRLIIQRAPARQRMYVNDRQTVSPVNDRHLSVVVMVVLKHSVHDVEHSGVRAPIGSARQQRFIAQHGTVRPPTTNHAHAVRTARHVRQHTHTRQSSGPVSGDVNAVRAVDATRQYRVIRDALAIVQRRPTHDEPTRYASDKSHTRRHFLIHGVTVPGRSKHEPSKDTLRSPLTLSPPVSGASTRSAPPSGSDGHTTSFPHPSSTSRTLTANAASRRARYKSQLSPEIIANLSPSSGRRNEHRKAIPRRRSSCIYPSKSGRSAHQFSSHFQNQG